ncbi:MAG: hypothetical protein J6K42_05070 [Clostridia bacterium]|nr:hypothetical protein [Clostridia bacterium]
MKKRVHYSVLEDMKKYLKDFNPDDFIMDVDRTDETVICYLQNYYDENLPVDVTAWKRVNRPRETLIYKEALGEQVCFVRDILSDKLVFADLPWDEHEEPMVISHHYSKSVKLPVYQIKREDIGIEFILRCNIYDWKISVKSDKPLDFDFMELFDPKRVIDAYYCEGFPKEKVYGSYEQNHSQFTVEIGSEYNVYTFFFLIRNYLNIKNNQNF